MPLAIPFHLHVSALPGSMDPFIGGVVLLEISSDRVKSSESKGFERITAPIFDSVSPSWRLGCADSPNCQGLSSLKHPGEKSGLSSAYNQHKFL